MHTLIYIYTDTRTTSYTLFNLNISVIHRSLYSCSPFSSMLTHNPTRVNVHIIARSRCLCWPDCTKIARSHRRMPVFFFRIVSNFNILNTLDTFSACWIILAFPEFAEHWHGLQDIQRVYGIALRVHAHGGPRFIASSEGLLWSLYRIWLRRNLRAGAKSSM